MTNKQNNMNVSQELRNEIKTVFDRFQEGYVNRDISKIDSFMEELFIKSDDAIIMGTSIGEWSLGYEQAKELIQSDWEYWGDLRFNNDLEIDAVGNYVWVTLTGTVKYEFNDEGNKYDRFIDLIKSFYDPENSNSELPQKYKTAHMNWFLTRVFQNRKDGVRTYLWPLRISAVLSRTDGILKFTEMQFCLPASSDYPDVKLDFDKSMQKDIEEGIGLINEYVERTGYCSCGDLKEQLTGFIQLYNDMGMDANGIAEKYFTSCNAVAVGADLSLHKGLEEIGVLLEKHRVKWDYMEINHQNIIQRVYGDSAFISAWGVLGKSVDEQQALKDLDEEILRIVELDIPSKEKIFRVQKQITLIHRELSSLQTAKWCFKLQGLLVKEADVWKFSKLQFSFPFYYYVEGMYDIDPV